MKSPLQKKLGTIIKSFKKYCHNNQANFPFCSQCVKPKDGKTELHKDITLKL